MRLVRDNASLQDKNLREKVCEIELKLDAMNTKSRIEVGDII